MIKSLKDRGVQVAIAMYLIGWLSGCTASPAWQNGFETKARDRATEAPAHEPPARERCGTPRR
jgi:hypothetical protein